MSMPMGICKFIGLLVGLCLYSFGVRANEPGVTETEVKFGCHSPQTGQDSTYGAIQRVAKAYLEMINQQGGVNGRKIMLLNADNGSSNQQALQMIKKQVEEDSVFAVLGAGGRMHLAVYKYLRDKKVPDLLIATSGSEYTSPPHPNTFQFSPTTASEGQFFGSYFVKKWPTKKIGILYVDDSYGAASVDAFKKSADGRLNIVGAEGSDPRTDPSAKAQILNLKKKGAEVIFFAAPGSTGAGALKFAHDQGYSPQWVIGYSAARQATIDLAGKAAVEGVISWNYLYFETETDVPAIKAHLEFLKKYMPSEKPSSLTVTGQALGETAIELLKRAGKDLTREGILKAAASFVDWKCSICRSPSNTAVDHLFSKPKVLMTIKDGRWVEIKE